LNDFGMLGLYAGTGRKTLRLTGHQLCGMKAARMRQMCAQTARSAPCD
jgi:hypothetical protein